MLEAYPPDLQDFVQRKIDAGEFKSADDFAVQAALIYRDMDLRRQELTQSVVEGIADIERGDYVEINGEDELREFFEDVKRRGRERLAELSRDS